MRLPGFPRWVSGAGAALTNRPEKVIINSTIHDGTQDQDLYSKQKGLPADAEALPGKAGEIVPAPPQGDGWVAEAVTAVETSITKLIDEFWVQPFIHRVEHSRIARSSTRTLSICHGLPWSRQGATEDVIAGTSERPKITCVHHDLEVKQVSYRHLGSPDITKEKYPPR